ncbi:MAG: hypothetical protein EBX52_03345 [Proteobacteria bacterium]|nr:hypothetical protein [Pseudomonadota bacterium]
MFRALFLFLLYSASAWASGLPKAGTYIDLEILQNGTYAARIFEIFDLKLPGALEEKVIRESREIVSPSSNAKSGFMEIKGMHLPHKVYLASRDQIRRGVISGAHLVGSNALSFIESDFDAHNQVVRSVLSRLRPDTPIKVEAAALVRIQISTGQFMLLPNKGTWNKGRGKVPKGTILPSAVGGVSEAEVASLFTLSGALPSFSSAAALKLERTITGGWTDLNLEFKASFLTEFLNWFESTPDRERDPTRELYEELVHENAIFSDEEWLQLGLHGSCSDLATKPR